MSEGTVKVWQHSYILSIAGIPIIPSPHRQKEGTVLLETVKLHLSKENIWALAGVAQWIECQLVNQRVTNSIPSQGTSLGCRPGPQLGAYKRQPHIDISLPLFLPP